MALARVLAILLFAAAFAPGVADAQELDEIEGRFGVERFRIASDRVGVLDAESGQVLPHLSLDVGLWLSYADDPLNVYRSGDIERDRVGSLISHRIGGNLNATLGLFERFQLGINVPLVLSQDQDVDGLGGPMSLSSVGVGSIELAPKVSIAGQEALGFDLGLVLRVRAPSAADDGYFGDSATTFAPELTASMPLTDRLRGAVNLGVFLREETSFLDLVVDDELYAHVGLGYMAYDNIELDTTLSIATGLDDFFGSFNRNSAELRGGLAIHLDELTVFSAAGAGVAQGFGTPDWRIVFGARFAAELGPRPTRAGKRLARDGPDVVDRNAVDSDGDGIVDSRDACPLAAGFLPRGSTEIRDGCPQPSAEPAEPAEPTDPTPPVEPTNPEPAPPEPDGDGDGVADAVDNCPAVAGPAERSGCPDEQLVRLTPDGIELLEPVYFETNNSVIRSESYKLLRNVAAVLVAHSELRHVRIEGHTDDRGSEAKNLALSQRRADAVLNFLVDSEVESERLEAVGLGESTPIGDNTTPAGRAKNRRVDFVVVTR